MVDFPILHTVKGFVVLRNHTAFFFKVTQHVEVDGDVCGRRECVGYTDSFEGIWIITVMEKMAPKAQHNVDFGYWVMMNNTGILAIKSRYMEWLINDVT